MPNEQLISALVDEFQKFLDNFERVCRVRIEHKSRAYQSLSPTLQRITRELHEQSDRAIREATNAWDERYELVIEALTVELRFFNELVENGGAGSGETPDAAATVKESFEDIIDDLPDWFKKFLKILNEILSLVR